MNHQETWDALLDEYGSDAEMPLALGQWWDEEAEPANQGEAVC